MDKTACHSIFQHREDALACECGIGKGDAELPVSSLLEFVFLAFAEFAVAVTQGREFALHPKGFPNADFDDVAVVEVREIYHFVIFANESPRCIEIPLLF